MDWNGSGDGTWSSHFDYEIGETLSATGTWDYINSFLVQCPDGIRTATITETFSGAVDLIPDDYSFSVLGTDLDEYFIPHSFFVLAPGVSFKVNQVSNRCTTTFAEITHGTGFPVTDPQPLPEEPWTELRFSGTAEPFYETSARVTSPDTDGDLVLDAAESPNLYPTRPDDPDTDDDCLDDGQEIWTYETNPNNPDSDGDGYRDDAEVAAGTDPNDSSSGADSAGACNLATIIVEKQTEPDTTVNFFQFTGAHNGLLFDDGSMTELVQPGTYQTTESTASGWQLKSIACDDSDSHGDMQTATATFMAAAGETIRCVFVNVPDDPCLPVVEDPVYCYAPEVRLHPNETTFPMGIGSFIAQSSLRWAHDGGCPDEEVEDYGNIDQGRLSGLFGAPYEERQAKPLKKLCLPEGRPFGSDELTRPSQPKKEKPDRLAANEGFYLDLQNGARGGDPVSAGESTAASYVSYEPGEYIDYWFMYGFNPGPARICEALLLDPSSKKCLALKFADRHEGEWERIMVELNPDGTAAGAVYFAHTCPGVRIPWDDVPKADDSHPVVYSAWGSHASYASEVDITYPGACPSYQKGQGIGDQTRDGGVTWKTWEHGLTDVATEEWYGFGGAWGEVGTIRVGTDGLAINTGPLAPPWKDPSSTDF
jgi:hypothetical protein